MFDRTHIRVCVFQFQIPIKEGRSQEANANAVFDCYSRAPINKPSLLAAMQEKFGLQYEITAATAGVNATGSKPHCYSLNTRAAEFGYQPALTSLEGIIQEACVVLGLESSRVI